MEAGANGCGKGPIGTRDMVKNGAICTVVSTWDDGPGCCDDASFGVEGDRRLWAWRFGGVWNGEPPVLASASRASTITKVRETSLG